MTGKARESVSTVASRSLRGPLFWGVVAGLLVSVAFVVGLFFIILLRRFLVPINFEAPVALAVVFVGFLLFFVLAGIILSISSANKLKGRSVDILARAQELGITREERILLIQIIRDPPAKAKGYTRAVIALTVLLVLGIALITAMLVPIQTPALDLVTPILGALTGLVAAITGFYYGGQAREGQKSPATGSPGPEQEPSHQPIVNIDYPQEGSRHPPGQVSVFGNASVPEKIKKVDVSLDGAKWTPASTERLPAVETRWNASVTLEKGPITIHARVTDTLDRELKAEVNVVVA